MAPSKRQQRLEQEWQDLQAVNRNSDNVRIEPLEVLPGRPPEKYKVSFNCRGIVGIDAAKNPVYGMVHEVEVYCHAGFPSQPPWLTWKTPMWHPNIEHSAERRVCINGAEWLGGMALSDLCQQMFEMVQYKNYHAEMSPPYPLDREAAAWVREVAEKRGIVDKKRGIFVDNRMFFKPAPAGNVRRIQIVRDEVPVPSRPSGPRIKFHRAGETQGSSKESNIVMEAGAGPIPCPRCSASLPGDSAFCHNCGQELRSSGRRRVFSN